MKDAPASRAIINLDRAQLKLGGGARCDYVAAFDYGHATRIAAIELKSGLFKAAAVAGQLQGGASFAQSSLPTVDARDFLPVLVHGRGVHQVQLRELRRQRIQYRGKPRQIVLMRCGEKMVKAIRP